MLFIQAYLFGEGVECIALGKGLKGGGAVVVLSNGQRGRSEAEVGLGRIVIT